MADREKVLKGLAFHLKELTIGKTCFDCPYWGDNPCEIQLIENVLELLKEQEPKTGHWIDSAGDDKCSVCRATYSVLYPDYHHTHYCPNRGAKMIVQAVEYSDASNEGVKWE